MNGIKALMKRVDGLLGYPIAGIRESRRVREREEYYALELSKRRSKYPIVSTSPEYVEISSRIERDGYAIIPNAVKPELVVACKEEFEAHLKKGSFFNKIAKDSERQPGDRNPATIFLSPEEVSRGQDYCRNFTNNMALNNPLLNTTTVKSIAFHPMLIGIATAYLKCNPAIGGLNLRKSFCNGLPEFDTQYFHVDPNSPRFLKFFLYLNKVELLGGPFCYVKGSHRKKFRGWQTKYRWNLDEIEAVYGKENVLLLTADVGDLVVADTNGFHRGSPIKSSDRGMLTVDYVVHQEFDGTAESFKISQSDFNSLPIEIRPAADFLDRVEK